MTTQRLRSFQSECMFLPTFEYLREINLLEINNEPNRSQHSDNEMQANKVNESSALLIEIKDAISAYKGSLSSLANKTGVDPKTIRKIANCEYKRAPNAETVQRLLSVVSKQRSLSAMAKHYGGEIETFLQKAFPQFFLEDAKTTDELEQVLLDEIKDQYSYQLYKLCTCTDNGIKKDELINTLTAFIVRTQNNFFHEVPEEEEIKSFRPLAILKIEQCIKSGLLKENRQLGTIESKYRHAATPFELVQKYEGDSLYFCEPEHWDKLDYFTANKFGNCSKKEITQISNILFNAYNEAKLIVKNSNSSEVSVNILSSFESLKYHTTKELK